MLQKQYWLQGAVSSALLVVIEIELNHSCDLRVIAWLGDCKNRTNTVKQWILYWTCTCPAVEVIGLAPTRD